MSMSTSARTEPRFLRPVLYFDAATCLLMAALLLIGGSGLGGFLGLPVGLLTASALILIGFAVVVLAVASRPVIPRTGVWAIAVVNILWAIDSLLILVLGWVEPNGLGLAFVIVQAVAVLLIAEIQIIGLKRGRPAGVAA